MNRIHLTRAGNCWVIVKKQRWRFFLHYPSRNQDKRKIPRTTIKHHAERNPYASSLFTKDSDKLCPWFLPFDDALLNLLRDLQSCRSSEFNASHFILAIKSMSDVQIVLVHSVHIGNCMLIYSMASFSAQPAISQCKVQFR